MKLSESNIIEVLSHPRFERTVAAIIRKRFRNPDSFEEEEEEATSPTMRLPAKDMATLVGADHGFITIEQVLEKYPIDEETLNTAISERWVRVEDGKVDEETLRFWVKNSNKKVPKSRNTEARPRGGPRLKERPYEADLSWVLPHYSVTKVEAAEMLGLSFPTIPVYLSYKLLVKSETGGVTLESVILRCARLGIPLDLPDRFRALLKSATGGEEKYSGACD